MFFVWTWMWEPYKAIQRIDGSELGQNLETLQMYKCTNVPATFLFHKHEEDSRGLKCFEYIENLRGLKKRGVRGGGTLAIKIDLCPIFRLHCLPPTSFLAQNFGFYFWKESQKLLSFIWLSWKRTMLTWYNLFVNKIHIYVHCVDKIREWSRPNSVEYSSRQEKH